MQTDMGKGERVGEGAKWMDLSEVALGGLGN